MKLPPEYSNNLNIELHWTFIIIFPQFAFTEPTESLRLTEVRIPNHVIRNNTVKLECHFDMNGEALYSVKWYKDGYEFYRYVPRDHPPAQVFHQTGINVDVRFCIKRSDKMNCNGIYMFSLIQQLQNSTDTQVVLDAVSLASTGRYRCEVSAEAPSFQTVSDHGDMVVVGKLYVF